MIEQPKYLILTLDIDRVLLKNEFDELRRLLKTFNINRSDIIPFVVALVDTVNIHVGMQSEEKIIDWLYRFGFSPTKRLIEKHYDINDVSDDLLYYVENKINTLVKKILLWVVEILMILPPMSKEITLLQINKKWNVRLLLRIG